MRSEAHYLFDIIDAAHQIGEFIKNKTLSDFNQDDLLRSAVLMKLFIIGEAVVNLSEPTKDRYGEIPWSAIKGFRNFIAHQYFQLRWEIVWNSAKERVPELSSVVEEILRNDYPGVGPEHA